MSAVVTERLTKCYGSHRGIDQVDLRIEEGTLFGFLGPNGAGKTTAIRVLLGLLRPTSGRARVLGRDCWSESEAVKREVGYLPGDLRLYRWLTGTRALRMVGRIRGVELERPGRALAERFGLDLEVRVHRMSRGTRQKLGLVLALAHAPRLAILDEPTSGLDPLVQDELARLLREMAADGHTIFFSSHTLSEVQQLCDRIAIVRAGRLVADETLADLRARARRAVRILFGTAEEARSAEPPAGLRLVERSGRLWTGDLEGEALGPQGLVRWLAEREIEDVSVSPPDLEGVFRRFYERDRGEA